MPGDSQIVSIGPKHPARAHQRVAGNALIALARSYWAIRSDYLAKAVEVLSRANMDVASLRAQGALPAPAAIDADPGERLDQSCYFTTVRDGIATIKVRGPITRYAMEDLCAGPSATYEDLAYEYRMALESAVVNGILWDFDTPGGEVNGCAEFAATGFKHRDAKPTAVYVSGDACSAGFWLATAMAGKIAIDRTALLGSIGVCATVTDFSGWEEKMGIKTIEIVSTQSPRKRVDVKTDDGRQEVVAILDALASVFVNDVAKHRGVGPEVVLRDFGGGGVFVGEDAITAGLADSVSSYEEVHAELRDRVATGSRASVVAADRTTPAPEAAMKSTTTDPAANAGGTTGAADTTSVCPECGATMQDGACPNGHTAAAADDMTDEEKKKKEEETPAAKERARIQGIMELGRTGEEKLVQECIADPSCTVEQAALRLRRAQGGSGSSYLAAVKGDESETPAPSNVRSSTATATVESLSDQIINAGRPAQKRPAR
jgi:ClpP class serine protease